MALGRQVVEFIWLRLLKNPDQVGGVREIPVVEDEISVVHMGILVEGVNAPGVKAGTAALDPVDNVALLQQQFGKVRSVLPGHSGNEGDLLWFTHNDFSS